MPAIPTRPPPASIRRTATWRTWRTPRARCSGTSTPSTRGPIRDEIRLPRDSTLTARVRLRSSVPVDHLEIIGNGRVVAAIPLTGDRTQASATVPIAVAVSGWYVLRAYADRAELPVLDRYPFSSTSPVYVTVGNEPVRSSEDADFFMRWIDRLDDAAEAHQGWNTAAEREHVLRLLAEARAVYAGRGVSGAPARSPGSP